jgi:hypothetical protein
MISNKIVTVTKLYNLKNKNYRNFEILKFGIKIASK